MERIDTFTHRGFTFALECDTDTNMGEPWREHDGHGVVSDWRRTYYRHSGRQGKRAGERELCSDDHGNARYYDVAESTRIAKRDGWGIGDAERVKLAAKLQREPTHGDIIAAAVERDYKYLRDWCEDRWGWLVLHVVLLDVDGDNTSADDYLGGVESSDMEYVKECGRDMADNIIATHELTRRKYLPLRHETGLLNGGRIRIRD